MLYLLHVFHVSDFIRLTLDPFSMINFEVIQFFFFFFLAVRQLKAFRGFHGILLIGLNWPILHFSQRIDEHGHFTKKWRTPKNSGQSYTYIPCPAQGPQSEWFEYLVLRQGLLLAEVALIAPVDVTAAKVSHFHLDITPCWYQVFLL